MTLHEICLIILLPLSILSLLLSCALYSQTKEQIEENKEIMRRIKNNDEEISGIYRLIEAMDKKLKNLEKEPQKQTISDVINEYLKASFKKSLEKEDDPNLVD